MQKQIIHLTRKDCYKKYTFLFNNLGNILNFNRLSIIRLALPAAAISGIKVDNNQKKIVQSGYEINLYSDRDYYHLDLLNCLEYWRMKIVFSDGSSVIQRYEVNWKTHEIKKI